MIQIPCRACPSPQADLIARLLPSGDQLGAAWTPGAAGELRDAASVRVHHIDLSSQPAADDGRPVKAIRCPSGDQSGSTEKWSGLEVSLWTSLPSGAGGEDLAAVRLRATRVEGDPSVLAGEGRRRRRRHDRDGHERKDEDERGLGGHG